MRTSRARAVQAAATTKAIQASRQQDQLTITSIITQAGPINYAHPSPRPNYRDIPRYFKVAAVRERIMPTIKKIHIFPEYFQTLAEKFE